MWRGYVFCLRRIHPTADTDYRNHPLDIEGKDIQRDRCVDGPEPSVHVIGRGHQGFDGAELAIERVATNCNRLC